MPKVCALTAKSLKFLSSLDSACRNNDVNKQSDLFVLNEELRSNKSNITWVIEKSLIDKKITHGDYIESPSIKISNPAILKIMLYPTGMRDGFSCDVSLSLHFKDFPENMYREGYVSVLGKNGDTLLSEPFSGNRNFFSLFHKSELRNYLVNNQLTIQCIINSISQIYKCVSGKSSYEVPNSPGIINCVYMGNIRKYSDVILEVDSMMIECHKFILASESQPLSILFKSCDRNILEMHDKSTTIIQELLDFIYLGSIRLFKFNHICQLYVAAYEFGVLNLKDMCSVFLSSCLSEKNVPYIFELSVKYGDQYLIEACITFVKANDIKSLRDTFMERSQKIKN